MKLRTIIGGLAAAIALSTATFAAGPASMPGYPAVQDPAPILRVQGSQALEEQVRRLNGQIEDLNFQIMQLQEQLRKMQEDNEMRFQELETGKRTDAGGGEQPARKAETAPAQQEQQQAAAPAPAEPAPEPGTASPAPEQSAGTTTDPTPGTGEPERNFGTIIFDQSGNVVGGSVGDTTTVSPDPDAALPPEADNTTVAALPPTDDPEELYRSAYDAILAGNYRAAEAGFRQHNERFPNDARAADAQFWLGESLLSQQKYGDAAEVFLGASKQFPQASKAPETLFKLGVSLAGIRQRDVACATFAAVGERYPGASDRLKERVASEQAKVRC